MSASGIDDRQRAARALLMRPLVRSASGDDFRLAKKYAPDLRDWFDTNTGWTLHVDSEVIRLAKEPATVGNPTHPIRGGKRSGLLTATVCVAHAVLGLSRAQR